MVCPVSLFNLFADSVRHVDLVELGLQDGWRLVGVRTLVPPAIVEWLFAIVHIIFILCVHQSGIVLIWFVIPHGFCCG